MSNGSEQREHERHGINEERFLILGGMQILVEDISWGGLRAQARVQVTGNVEVKASEGGEGSKGDSPTGGVSGRRSRHRGGSRWVPWLARSPAGEYDARASWRVS